MGGDCAIHGAQDVPKSLWPHLDGSVVDLPPSGTAD